MYMETELLTKIMKKLLITLNLIMFLAACQATLADDDWVSVYEGFDNAEYGKMVSEKEYLDAVKTMEKYSKKNKKDKKKEDLSEEKKPEIKFDRPAKTEPLLALVTDVDYKGKPIERGFYLANAINKDNRHFIRLSLGEGKIIADIEANVLNNKNEEKKIFSEIMDNGILKLTYTDYDIILEAYLWIQ